jgi:hypothetical protein
MRRAVLGLVLVLTACTSPAGPPAGTALVRAEPRPSAAPPLARGETQLLVRAVSASAPGQEVAGAACRAESAYFTAAFVAPAAIRLPDYGSASPPVTVRCRAGGGSGIAVARPEAVWQRGLGGFPAVGVSVGTGGMSGVGVGVGWVGGGAGVSTGEPVIRYPDLRVPLG